MALNSYISPSKKKLAKHLQNFSIQTKEHISWFISNTRLLLWQSAEEQFVAETSPKSKIYTLEKTMSQDNTTKNNAANRHRFEQYFCTKIDA